MLVLHKRLCKRKRMENCKDGLRKEEKKGRWKEDYLRPPKSSSRGLFEKRGNESDEERADRILLEMENSYQRMDRILKVFDRMP